LFSNVNQKVQGVVVKNLRHACKLIEQAIQIAKGPMTETLIPMPADDKSGRPPIIIDSRFIRLDFSKGPVIILDAATAEKDTQEMLEEHLIHQWRTPDLE
jgi:hypothetical protein